MNNLTLITPSDPWETAAETWAAAHVGPVFIRLSRMPVPLPDFPDRAFAMGRAEILCPGANVTLITCGTTVHLALAAADHLAASGTAAAAHRAIQRKRR